ncbi:PREDICTED: protein FANTASTIC FOUR 2-like [Nicotiana attenuata]|uniref:Protein fantastic four 3 n=1 Tax=Nicotiana attenuata TaxID=49451 RepID=A0A1J6IKF0_NICAT|nr:PREDICTED: protein FANTASTIC FOUR 2-like [Nicotiana attenuata]OIT05597.1 protein fantastic four 3 [Nicotiana attenuata]
MASTAILCQGLQSCMEPQLPEQHVLINKLSPPMLIFSQTKFNIFSQEAKAKGVEPNEEIGVRFNELQSQHGNDNKGGWSFLRSLDNAKKDNAENEVYIHPLTKRSSSTLSPKSLEMCTENLGSETGSDISESIEENYFFLSERQNSHDVRRSKRREFIQKHNKTATFPPPLTSLNGVQVRPYREGGRLILKATTITSCKSCFHTERADGRLRLSLMNDGINTHIPDSYEQVETEAEAEAQVNEHENVGSEKGVGEYVRPRKCKESGNRVKGIPSWEPFWVAIS